MLSHIRKVATTGCIRHWNRGPSQALISAYGKSNVYLQVRRAAHTQVYTWGNSIDGQLGHGDQTARKGVTAVEALDAFDIRLVSCSETTTFASYLKNGKESVCGFGSNQFGILSFDEEDPPFALPTRVDLSLSHINSKNDNNNNNNTSNNDDSILGDSPIRQIACENGKLYTWGNGVHGQLGTGGAPDMKLPALVKSLEKEKIVKCAAGTAHAMCITEDGKLFTWGNSHFAQLGHKDYFNENTPRQVKLDILKGKKVIDIGGGLYHTVVLTDRNEVYSWGRNDEGQCGQTNSPIKVVEPNMINTSHIRKEKIVKIECGLIHTLLLTDSGKVISFGSNKSGQIGNEPRENTMRSLPKIIEGFNSPISQISCGGFHSLAFSGTTLYGWGENSDYQLGLGNTRTSSFVPVAIPGLEGLSILQMAAGMGHSVVVTAQNKAA